MDVWKPHGARFTSLCSRVKIRPLLTDIKSCSSNSPSPHKNCLFFGRIQSHLRQHGYICCPPSTLLSLNSQGLSSYLSTTSEFSQFLPELFCLLQAACQDTFEAHGSYRPLQVTSPLHPTLTWQSPTERFSLYPALQDKADWRAVGLWQNTFS